jgi:hypothetical protein
MPERYRFVNVMKERRLLQIDTEHRKRCWLLSLRYVWLRDKSQRIRPVVVAIFTVKNRRREAAAYASKPTG